MESTLNNGQKRKKIDIEEENLQIIHSEQVVLQLTKLYHNCMCIYMFGYIHVFLFYFSLLLPYIYILNF